MKLGKKLGLIAFIISQFLVLSFTGLYFYCIITVTPTDITFFQITAFEGLLFSATWGTKAFKNYLDSKKE